MWGGLASHFGFSPGLFFTNRRAIMAQVAEQEMLAEIARLRRKLALFEERDRLREEHAVLIAQGSPAISRSNQPGPSGPHAITPGRNPGADLPSGVNSVSMPLRPELSICPNCRARVRADKLRGHIQRRCPKVGGGKTLPRAQYTDEERQQLFERSLRQGGLCNPR